MSKNASPSTEEYFIVSLKHLQREHLYVTLWRDKNAGYAWPLSWAGRYSKEDVLRKLHYYNSGPNVAVPCSVIEALAVEPIKGYIDGDAGPVVPSNRTTWKKILASVIAEPTLEMVPVYPGARGKARMAYSRPKHSLTAVPA